MTIVELLAKARKDYPPGTIFESNVNKEYQPEKADREPYIYNIDNCIAVKGSCGVIYTPKLGWAKIITPIRKVKNVFKTFI